MVYPCSEGRECRFRLCSIIWRAATRWKTSWKDSPQFPAHWHWKRLKKPSNCCWQAPDASSDRRVRRRALKASIPRHDCQTARFANLAGLKNGRLLDAAEAAGFDILITADQNIPDQQNLAGRRISLVILCGPTNRLRDLKLLVPAAVLA